MRMKRGGEGLERLGGGQITDSLRYHDKWFMLLGDGEESDTGEGHKETCILEGSL